MKKLLILLLALSLCSISFVSCSRVQEPAKGELKVLKLKKLNAIPTEYGSLVGVTANPEFSGWAQLWFEDDGGIIRVVSVGFDDQKIREDVTVIPRN